MINFNNFSKHTWQTVAKCVMEKNRAVSTILTWMWRANQWYCRKKINENKMKQVKLKRKWNIKLLNPKIIIYYWQKLYWENILPCGQTIYQEPICYEPKYHGTKHQNKSWNTEMHITHKVKNGQNGRQNLLSTNQHGQNCMD